MALRQLPTVNRKGLHTLLQDVVELDPCVRLTAPQLDHASMHCACTLASHRHWITHACTALARKHACTHACTQAKLLTSERKYTTNLFKVQSFLC
jgi:hypothetical protein